MDEEFVKRLEEEQEVPEMPEEELDEEQEVLDEEQGEDELAPLPELDDDFDYGNEQPLDEGEYDEPLKDDLDQDQVDEELEEIEEMDEVH